MRFATKEQLQDVVEYMGNNIHVPQLVQHFDAENIYSIDERMIGSWVDGRPLYQKSIAFGTLPNKNTKKVAHGIANIKEVITIKTIGYATTWYNIPWATTKTVAGENDSLNVYVDTTDIIVQTAADASAETISYITLQYTKTTDAANSYKIAKENDYCMQERIIGTWEDDEGKNLLCRKTYKITIPTTQTADSLKTLVETFTVPVFPLKIEALQFNPNRFSAASNSFYTNNWPSVNVYTDGTYKKLTVEIEGIDVSNYKGCIFYAVVDYVKGNS